MNNEQRIREERKDELQTFKLEDFYYDAGLNRFWNEKTGVMSKSDVQLDAIISTEYWPANPVRRRRRNVPRDEADEPTRMRPSHWLKQFDNGRVVNDSVYWPGMPSLLLRRGVREGIIIDDPASRLFNSYVPPDFPATKESPLPWIDHCKNLYDKEDEHNYFFDYAAHMLQRPEEKANTVIGLAGEQGIGKDLMLLPLRRAVGPTNHRDIVPQQMDEQFNPWCATVMLTINEIKGSSQDHASSFYNRLKTYAVTPPETFTLNNKNVDHRAVVNCLRIFMTMNNVMDLFIEEGDRRVMIMNAVVRQGWRDAAYFTNLFNWFLQGEGVAAVAQWLRARDISAFNPKKISPRTSAWHAVTQSWGEADDAFGRALDKKGRPDFIFTREIRDMAQENPERDEVRKITDSGRALIRRAEKAGYFVFDCRNIRIRRNGNDVRLPVAIIKKEHMERDADWLLDELKARAQDYSDGKLDPDINDPKVARIDDHRPKKGDF